MRVWVMAALVWASSAGAVTIRLNEVAYAHITERSNGHVGGYYGSDPLELNHWFGQSTTVSLSNGVLTVLHQQSRGSNYAGIVLAPEVFGGQAGVYRLNFDVLDLVLNNTGKDQGVLGETHYGRVSVWSGQGYDLSQASGQALWGDALAGTLTGKGGASVESLNSITIAGGGDGYSLDFAYDGSSAVALFFGAESTQKKPAVTAEYGNITVTPVPVPEPSTGLMVLVALGLLRRRRPRAAQRPSARAP